MSLGDEGGERRLKDLAVTYCCWFDISQRYVVQEGGETSKIPKLELKSTNDTFFISKS